MITLEAGQFGWDFIIRKDDNQSVLIQTDWDYPSVAQSFGWSGLCRCGFSDGTIDCVDATASQHIAAARAWLDANIGATAEDPGYFLGGTRT